MGKGMSWNSVYKLVSSYIVSIATPEGRGTGFLFAYNTDRSIMAFATAAHVVDHAHDWKQPLRLIHHDSEKEMFVEARDRVILLYRQRDSASILVGNAAFSLPPTTLPLMPPDKVRRIGDQVAWAGFPSIAYPNLCFFAGRVSAYLDDDKSYLIDGVAINGVSGGPVFAQRSGAPQIIGTVSAYMPNRVRGETLPGLLRAQDLTAFHRTIEQLRSLDEAREQEAEESKQAQKKAGEAGA
jgi:hypothetical protein